MVLSSAYLQSLLIGLYRFKSIIIARIVFTWRAGLLLHKANLYVIKEQLLQSCLMWLYQASDTQELVKNSIWCRKLQPCSAIRLINDVTPQGCQPQWCSLSSQPPGPHVTHKSKWQLCDNMESCFLGFESVLLLINNNKCSWNRNHLLSAPTEPWDALSWKGP